MSYTERMLEAEYEAFLNGERAEDIFVAYTSYGVGTIEREWDE